MEKLLTLGYAAWIDDRIDAEKAAVHELARVVSVHKDSCQIMKGGGEVFAELSGRLSYTADSVLDLPTTGDWVYADFYDDDTHAVIHGVVPRKTLLKRKASGKLIDFQLIAANIDTAFIIMSVDYNFNLRRLERYLVMVYEGGITPVVLLSKSDLVSEDELLNIKDSVSGVAPGVTVIAFSNLSGENSAAINELLVPGHTYCLIGSSGVGKTTLLNTIIGKERFATQTVSKKENKGRHTTTSRELIQLDSGVLLIDTPGMRELGNLSVDSGMDEAFSDVLALEQKCRFSNCSHENEKGCAVLAAIRDGELTEKRFNNYLKMKRESEFNEMSYIEKRKKDKEFGKMIKSVVKNKSK